MKTFEAFGFDTVRCRQELDELGALLAQQASLSERAQVLRFFRKRKHLSAFVGSFNANLSSFDRLAFEYDLFGDFVADLVIGDACAGVYLLVEFEDAGTTSIFRAKKDKATLEWAPRFEQGFSQVVDWFWKLADMEPTHDFRDRFGEEYAGFEALLVIGRLTNLGLKERQRLKWRREQVKVGAKSVHCVTFDELFAALDARLRMYEAAFLTDRDSSS